MSTNSPTLPLVSVIIPSYNCELYIEETINSILAQTYPNIEIIVVDDGSTDRTCELVTAYGNKLRLIQQQNARVCAARNRGIREAQGQFICLMDHDDYWFPHKIAVQVNAMNNHLEAGGVYSKYFWWHRDATGQYPKPASYEMPENLDEIDTAYSGWVYHLFLLDCHMLTSSAMFRAEVFTQCGNFDEKLPYSEDWDLWLRITQRYPLIKLSCPTTLYRQHPNQGYRVVRDVDYRTELLQNAVKRWGFASKDGRCISARQFYKQLAHYHAEFGGDYLQAGRRMGGIAAFSKAWRCDPLNWRYPAYIVAAFCGWVPRW